MKVKIKAAHEQVAVQTAHTFSEILEMEGTRLYRIINTKAYMLVCNGEATFIDLQGSVVFPALYEVWGGPTDYRRFLPTADTLIICTDE